MHEEGWQNISSEAKKLVQLMLTYNPKDRINALDAIRHPWIQENTKNEVNERLIRNTLINLKNFNVSNDLFRINSIYVKGDSKIKQALLAFIATHLSKEEEKRDLDKIFKIIDIDGDGQLSKKEIFQCYQDHFGIPISSEELESMFAKIDLDGNGTIDYTEFLSASVNQKNLLTDEKIRMAL